MTPAHGRPSPLSTSSLPRALPPGRPRHDPYPLERAVNALPAVIIGGLYLAVELGRGVAGVVRGVRVGWWLVRNGRVRRLR